MSTEVVPVNPKAVSVANNRYAANVAQVIRALTVVILAGNLAWLFLSIAEGHSTPLNMLIIIYGASGLIFAEPVSRSLQRRRERKLRKKGWLIDAPSGVLEEWRSRTQAAGLDKMPPPPASLIHKLTMWQSLLANDFVTEDRKAQIRERIESIWSQAVEGAKAPIEYIQAEQERMTQIETEQQALAINAQVDMALQSPEH